MYLDKMIEIKAYFGMNINTPEGTKIVTDQAFAWFQKTHLDSRFDGYTIEHGEGSWKGTRENCRILSMVYHADSNDIYLAGHKLAEAIEIYNREFKQDCVLVTQTEIKGMFLSND